MIRVSQFIVVVAVVVMCATPAAAQKILIPMDLNQSNHLKAYGVAYRALTRGHSVQWLLNYRGGAFIMPNARDLVLDARLKNVDFEEISGTQVAGLYREVEANNMELVQLEKAPRIAVYIPPVSQPWDDAVTLAMTYAEIPYDKVFDVEVLAGKLGEYDWLHLHHEDFTGQYGKFYATYRNAAWYQKQQRQFETTARELGFSKVSELKKSVVEKIQQYVFNGGFLFAMCSATDTFDIALAATGVDIVSQEFDYDGLTPSYQTKLDYSNTLAFTGFKVIPNPFVYEFSDIDTSDYVRARGSEADYFTLFEFSAKYDPVPTMLTQNHVNVVKGFLGQTTGFKKPLVKKSVVVLGEDAVHDEVKYLHGNFGRGTFTFLGGHDPEDYQHAVGDPPTDLALHTNSPGYRLILNNVLFPAAKKKKMKT